jgi:HD-GYP domain-containing protein (c-di-GMP phosphodiesterase class II)
VARLSDLVRGPSLRPPSDGDSAQPINPTGADNGSESARRWYAEARQELRRIRDGIRGHLDPPLTVCEDLARSLAQEIQDSDECLRLALRGHTDDYSVDNALHVAVLSATLGAGMRYSRQDVAQLALTGLLHDVGMWTLPAALHDKAGRLTAEELDAVRAHPERGRRILAGLGGVYGWVSGIVAQEHERWDGSGYPCRLKGADIAEQAQIIGLADVFDALVTARPYKKAIAPHQALRELLVHGKQAFSHAVLRVLGDYVTLYPVGTDVRLNTGEIGRVVKVNPRYPLRPRLEIPGEGRAGTPGRRGELDLSVTASVHIVEVLQPSAIWEG